MPGSSPWRSGPGCRLCRSPCLVGRRSRWTWKKRTWKCAACVGSCSRRAAWNPSRLHLTSWLQSTAGADMPPSLPGLDPDLTLILVLGAFWLAGLIIVLLCFTSPDPTRDDYAEPNNRPRPTSGVRDDG